MRNKLLLAWVSIATLLTGCSKENIESFATSRETTDFKVSVDDGVKTRADGQGPTRYVMEIYKGATAAGTPELHKEQAQGTFTDVVLDDKQAYIVLFWADYGTPSADGTHPAANEYNAADLKAAKIAKQPTAAAYAGVSRFTVGTTDESVYTNVTLNHAVAQVNFKQTEALTTASNTLEVKYPTSYSLNVGDNAVTETPGEVAHTFTYNSKAAGTLGTSYIIAATGTPKTLMDITATLNGETAKTVTNVPFERSYRTHISGAYSDKYEATLNVTCDDEWETPDNEGEIASLHFYDNNTEAVVPEGEGTEVSPYLLASAANIKWLQELTETPNTTSGKYFKLMTDIEVTTDTWTPIAARTSSHQYNSFMGIFDGNGHQFTGKLVAAVNTGTHFGIFDTIGVGSEVSNLTNAAEVVAPNVCYVGGIAGQSEGNLTRCKNTAKITAAYYVGGIAGYGAYKDDKTATGTKTIFSYCENSGEIIALKKELESPTVGAGGIIGNLFYMGSANVVCLIDNCKNTGNVSAVVTGGLYVGGILGLPYISNGTCKLKGCINSGTIKSGEVTATQVLGGDNMLGLLVGGTEKVTVIE